MQVAGRVLVALSKEFFNTRGVMTQSYAASNGKGTLHVCLFPGQLQLGGVGRNTINLAEELLSRGVRVDFFLSKRAGVYVPQIPEQARVFEGSGTVRGSVPQLIRYLRNEHPHMLISARPYINLAAIVAARFARVPTKVVVTERVAPLTHTRFHGGLRAQLIKYGCRILYPKAAHIVAVSDGVARELGEIVDPSRAPIQVIHNGVVTQRMLEKSRQELADPWLDASSSPIVLGVGRLTLQKDFPTLIKAFARVRERLQARLIILGEGEDRAELEQLVRDLGLQSDVYMPGFVANPYPYLARADVFVLSSGWEGLPTTLIEALALGTPVVSTDCPGASREILVDGEFGELVPIGDAPAMARAMEAVLEHPPRPDRLQERAQAFSVAVAADRYLELIGVPGLARQP
jgi:glycosyltransferase involved in cell wall biosynthesis